MKSEALYPNGIEKDIVYFNGIPWHPAYGFDIPQKTSREEQKRLREFRASAPPEITSEEADRLEKAGKLPVDTDVLIVEPNSDTWVNPSDPWNVQEYTIGTFIQPTYTRSSEIPRISKSKRGQPTSDTSRIEEIRLELQQLVETVPLVVGAHPNGNGRTNGHGVEVPVPVQKA